MSGHGSPPGDPGGTLNYYRQAVNDLIIRSPSTQEAVKSLVNLSQLNNIPSILDREFLSQLDCNDDFKNEINEVVNRGFWISEKGDRIDLDNKINIHSNILVKSPQKMELDASKNINKKYDHEIILYSVYDTGPFIINIESADNTFLHYQRVGKLLAQNNNNYEIIRVTKRGRNRMAVYFKNMTKANEFLGNEEFLKQYNFKAYIPRHLVTSKAIVRGIDPEFTEADILKNIKSLGKITKIINVRRIKRKSKENKELVNTSMIVLTCRVGKNFWYNSV
ncbi:unnamed protein product, partial [Brassicogethes aeneus]